MNSLPGSSMDLRDRQVSEVDSPAAVFQTFGGRRLRTGGVAPHLSLSIGTSTRPRDSLR